MNLDIRKLILLVENIKIYYICFFIYTWLLTIITYILIFNPLIYLSKIKKIKME